MQALKLKIKEIDRFLFSIIEKLENQKMTLAGWLLTFLALVFLRNFFETLSSKGNVLSAQNWGIFWCHSVSYLLCWLLAIILFIYLLTKEKIEKISKLALLGAALPLFISILESLFTLVSGEAIRNKYELLPAAVTFPDLLKIFVGGYLNWGIRGLFLFLSESLGGTKMFVFVLATRIIFLTIILVFFKYIFSKTKSVSLVIFYGFFLWILYFFAYFFLNREAVDYSLRFSPEYFWENLGPHLVAIFCSFICGGYVLLKTGSILRVFFLAAFFCLLGFFAAYFPFIFAVIFKFPPTVTSFYGASNINPNFEWNKILFSLYFVLIFGLANLWFFIYDKNKFFVLWKNLRLARFFHNLAMLSLGFYIAVILAPTPYGVGALPQAFNVFDSLFVIVACFSLLFFWFSAIGYDDIFDEKIDRISNTGRPLCQNKFSKEEFKTLSNIFRALSYFLAAIIGYGFFIFIFLRSLIVHIYSAPPFRLKRFPILATFLLSLAALFTVLAGFVLTPNNSVLDFPEKLILFILIAFTFGFMVKDIKDYQGDRAGGIYTIPVIFGEKKGKIIIGVLVFLVFLLPLVFFPAHLRELIFPSLSAGILSFWLINRKNYSEKPLFLLYFSYGIFLVLTAFTIF